MNETTADDGNSSGNDDRSPLQDYKDGVDMQAYMFHLKLLPSTNAICYTMIAFGMLGNILAFLVVWINKSKFHGSFRRVMLATSVLDLLFLITRVIKDQTIAVDQVTLMLNLISAGVCYSFSLMSDLLALAITAERYIALVFPIRFQTMTPKSKRIWWICVVMICALVAMTRLHYSFVNFNYSLDGYANSLALVAITFFSDSVVPFLLTAASLGLVGCMSYAVYGRYKAKHKSSQIVDVNANNSRIHEMINTLSLLATLLFVCFLDQLGYVFYEITLRVVNSYTDFSFVSIDQIDRYYVAQILYVVWSHYSAIFEILARSAGFFLYLLFNRTFRVGFIYSLKGRWQSTSVHSKGTLDSRIKY